MPSRKLGTLDDSDTDSDPTGKSIHQHSRPTKAFVVPVISASVAILLIFLVLIIALFIYRRRRRKGVACRRTAPSSPPVSDLKKPLDEGERVDGSVSLSQPQRFTYNQLRRATGCFALSNKVGQGGFGSVFRGVIQGGKEIAVKLMDSGSFQGEIEFQNELSLAASVMQFEDRVLSLAHVVFPLGFCEKEEKKEEVKRKKKMKNKNRKRNWFDNEDVGDLDFDMMDDGFDGIERRVLILVYEFMDNGSLQDALLVRKRPEMMEWRRRFAVVVDVANGLEFLHTICNPPIIHGDIKPSNVLLDSFFSAKIADFGLARPLTPALLEASSPPLNPFFSAKLENDSTELVGDVGINLVEESTVIQVDAEDNGSIAAVETESAFLGVSQESPEYEGDGLALVSPGASPMTSEVGGFDKLSMDSGPPEFSGIHQGQGDNISRNAGGDVRIPGKDWWWPQDRDGNSESGSRIKDYVMEWIGSEIGNTRPNASQLTTITTGPIVSNVNGSTTRPPPPKVKKKLHRSLDCWNSLDLERRKKKEKIRPAREWWREEYTEELARKKQKKQMMAMPRSSSGTIFSGGFGRERQWWQKSGKDFGMPSDLWSGTKKSRKDNTDGVAGVGDLRMLGRRSSNGWANGDIPKSGGGVSSTPSMRGTMCYSAPEAGGETLSEKCDIYSFGVLLLVIISGRRPLQVTASPMSEFERANLISWARHLARKGKLFDLVDSSIVAVDREQALLCIRIALLCLQRSPSRRPSIENIVQMLSGTIDPPQLPVELLSSHQAAYMIKSRKKAR
ncbi:Kinase family protein [Zostera marina]|uniref:Kinase family protein n=1 Tax=Zostera marina TaxID=29655 RepID=A0A0K9PCH1_ZOSMR|nr:Kinase family protein [Zostera marina]